MSSELLSSEQPISSNDLCCFCGKSASQNYPFNARMQSTKYYPLGKSRRVTLSYGGEISAPYCDAHYVEALATNKKILKYHSINSDAGCFLIAACYILTYFFVKNSSFTGIKPAPVDAFVVSIIGTVIIGSLLAGLLLFIFEPLFKTLSGILFPLFLSTAVRTDLRAHINAHKEGWYSGQLPYLPGISVKYSVTNPEGIPETQTIFVTDPRHAIATGRKCIVSPEK